MERPPDRSRFVLVPCRVRADMLVADGEPLELDWAKLVALLAPSQSYEAVTNLRRLKTNTYVGLIKRAPRPGLPKHVLADQLRAPPTNFLFQNPDPNSREIDWILKKHIPDFSDVVKTLYRVDVALYDTKMEEPSDGKPNV